VARAPFREYTHVMRVPHSDCITIIFSRLIALRILPAMRPNANWLSVINHIVDNLNQFIRFCEAEGFLPKAPSAHYQ
jgi:hypothetical protein